MAVYSLTMDFLYHIIIGVAILAASPFVVARMVVNSRYRQDLSARLRGARDLPSLQNSIWIHAASVGEVRTAQILIQALKDQGETRPIALSTFTPTGCETAHKEGMDHVFRLPPDSPLWINPVFEKINPAVLILIEAEFWPCLLRKCNNLRIPVFLANGRMTQKAFERYNKIRVLFGWITEPIRTFSMRTREDADRILNLGVSGERVKVTGNIKFDTSLGESAEREKTKEENASLLVFGSTRPGDEGPAMDAILKLRKEHPQLKFAIAPRHLERCQEVEDLIREYDIPFQLHSQLDGNTLAPGSLVLIDRMGELKSYYAKADAAFVGGGFNPRFGGQNILEPAAFDLPVIYGKHMDNFEEEARLLRESGGGIQINHPGELFDALHRLLSDPDELRRRGAEAGNTVRANRGAVQRTVQLIKTMETG